jgi:hypothetical protein
MKKLLFLLLCIPSVLDAQTVRGDRFTFNLAPCTMRTGSGAPSGGLGVLCDTYIDTTTGVLWLKQAGGWVVSGVMGTGTPGTLAKWATSISIGDSSVSEYSSPAILKFAPAGDIEVLPAGGDVIPQNYSTNLGLLTNKWLSLHAAELWVETLVAQATMATIGGRILVAPTNILTSDLAAATTTIAVKYNNLSTADRIYMEASGKVEFMAITGGPSGAGPYSYTVTRNLDGSGANDWNAGDAILNTGQDGNGFIDLYSVRGVKAGTEIGPTIVGNVRQSATYNDWSPRWAIGNLNGLYGYSGSTYGSAFGVPSGARVTVDGTNGVRLYDGSNNLRISLGTGGTATFSGDGDDITNIDGGNIQTNSITVGQINATGFGDNVIKNGTFEGATNAVGIAGWAEDFHVGAFAISQSTGGQNGPATLLLSPGNGNYTSASYFAVPVVVGQTYRVALKVYADATTASGFYLRIHESNSSAFVRRVLRSGATAPDVNQVTWTDLCVSCAVNSGWQSMSFVYTVPSGVTWVSMSLIDFTGSGGSGSTYTDLKFDDVEMQKQIGAGHITAGSITADKITVTSLSALSTNVGTLTAGTIDGVTIRAGSGDEVTLDSSGVTLAAGTGANNSVKWSDGSAIRSASDQLNILSDNVIFVDGTSINLNTNTEVDGVLRVNTLGGGGNRYVCTDNDGDLSASAGSCPAPPAPASVPAAVLLEQIADLQVQVNELRAQLQSLLLEKRY